LHKSGFLFAIGLLVSACGSSTTPSTTLTVTSISPSCGTTAGGTNVTIGGTNFPASPTVTIGGSAATNIALASSTSITATTPQHAEGATDVVVSGAGGARGSLAGAFSYISPQSLGNTPPVINSIVVQGSVGPREPTQFASLDESVTVTANVSDAETPVSQLTFQWSSDVGTFSGTGSRVTWTAPHTLSGTPANVTLKLTVLESVQAKGCSVNNVATGTTSVRVHDSLKEVNDLAVDFLVGFSKQLDPAFVVRNFSDTCGGKADEQGDVQKDNDQNVINSYTIGAPQTSIVFIGRGGCPFRAVFGDACAQVPVEWHSTRKSTGANEISKGTDQVTAILENDQWRLCASDFKGDPTQSSLAALLMRRYR
jgi:hypothetical protein